MLLSEWTSCFSKDYAMVEFSLVKETIKLKMQGRKIIMNSTCRDKFKHKSDQLIVYAEKKS